MRFGIANLSPLRLNATDQIAWDFILRAIIVGGKIAWVVVWWLGPKFVKNDFNEW